MYQWISMLHFSFQIFNEKVSCISEIIAFFYFFQIMKNRCCKTGIFYVLAKFANHPTKILWVCRICRLPKTVKGKTIIVEPASKTAWVHFHNKLRTPKRSVLLSGFPGSTIWVSLCLIGHNQPPFLMETLVPGPILCNSGLRLLLIRFKRHWNENIQELVDFANLQK